MLIINFFVLTISDSNGGVISTQEIPHICPCYLNCDENTSTTTTTEKPESNFQEVSPMTGTFPSTSSSTLNSKATSSYNLDSTVQPTTTTTDIPSTPDLETKGIPTGLKLEQASTETSSTILSYGSSEPTQTFTHPIETSTPLTSSTTQEASSSLIPDQSTEKSQSSPSPTATSYLETTGEKSSEI